jgi:hypothetical protein
MKTKIKLAGLALLALTSTLSSAAPLGTAFTYQGRLQAGGAPANGVYDLQCVVHDAEFSGLQIGATFITNGVGVSNGLFTTMLDFGPDVFDGNARWLIVAVRTNGGGGFTVLSPRQPLAPAPQALYARAAGTATSATTAGSADSVSAANITGTVSLAQLAGPVLTNNQTGVTLGGTFSGNGSALTSLNAANVSGGTLADARLSGNVARTNQVWLLGGNAGTTPGAQFLGTSDNQPLEFKVNGMRALRLEDNGDGSDLGSIPDGAPNVVAGSPWNFVGPGVVGATISGGGATNYYGIVSTNAVLADYANVGGGLANRIGSFAATIAGGQANNIGTNSHYSAIGGGYENDIAAHSELATIAGGVFNNISTNSWYAAIGGGYDNDIAHNSRSATIAGGEANELGAHSRYGSIGGGYNNSIYPNSAYATIPGGYYNSATDYAFAAGTLAKANHTGAFVWADPTGLAFSSTATNQFLIRATGNVGINKNNPATALDVNGTVTATTFSGALRLNDGDIYLRGGSDTNHGLGWFGGGKTFAGFSANGPVLYGYSGGILGVTGGTAKPTLTWGSSYVDVYGDLGVTNTLFADTGGQNNGALKPGLTFGGSHSGEGIASKRTSGGNQYGLDFYVNSIARLSITHNGNVGINKNNPATALDVNGTVTATSFSGSGAGLTGLSAGSLSGTLADARLSANVPLLSAGKLPDSVLSANVALLNGSQTFTGAKSFSSPIHLNNGDIFFRGSADENHGLGWFGFGKEFAGVNLDGPVLYGCDGGGLGTRCNTNLALRWKGDGNVIIDPNGQDNGAFPRLSFGGGGAGNAAGIASKRTTGGNQYGLDFWAGDYVRLRISSVGNVGIGRSAAANRLELAGNASKDTAGSWLANSDARIKTDVATITNALATLDRVRLVNFRYTDDYRAAHPGIEDRAYLNVVAQEFQEVFPDSVQASGEKLADGGEILQVDTYPLTIYSAAAIQELRRELQEQRDENAQLKHRLEKLESLLLPPTGGGQ